MTDTTRTSSGGISPLALTAKRVIDAAWLHGPSYDLASQAAVALESAQLLQSPETAAEARTAALREAADHFDRMADQEPDRHGYRARVMRGAAVDVRRLAKSTPTDSAPAPTGPLTIYRASHDSIVMGLYCTAAEARRHCETELRREIGDKGTLGWVPDDGSDLAPEELSVFGPDEDEDGPEETCTGYVVDALEVAAEYDEEADQ